MREDITFTYTNHRGKTSVRFARPINFCFGSTEYHPEPQWLMHAFDLDKNAERTFAMKDIKDWGLYVVSDESGASAGFGVGPRI